MVQYSVVRLKSKEEVGSYFKRVLKDNPGASSTLGALVYRQDLDEIKPFVNFILNAEHLMALFKDPGPSVKVNANHIVNHLETIYLNIDLKTVNTIYKVLMPLLEDYSSIAKDVTLALSKLANVITNSALVLKVLEGTYSIYEVNAKAAPGMAKALSVIALHTRDLKLIEECAAELKSSIKEHDVREGEKLARELMELAKQGEEHLKARLKLLKEEI